MFDDTDPKALDRAIDELPGEHVVLTKAQMRSLVRSLEAGFQARRLVINLRSVLNLSPAAYAG